MAAFPKDNESVQLVKGYFLFSGGVAFLSGFRGSCLVRKFRIKDYENSSNLFPLQNYRTNPSSNDSLEICGQDSFVHLCGLCAFSFFSFPPNRLFFFSDARCLSFDSVHLFSRVDPSQHATLSLLMLFLFASHFSRR